MGDSLDVSGDFRALFLTSMYAGHPPMPLQRDGCKGEQTGYCPHLTGKDTEASFLLFPTSQLAYAFPCLRMHVNS